MRKSEKYYLFQTLVAHLQCTHLTKKMRNKVASKIFSFTVLHVLLFHLYFTLTIIVVPQALLSLRVRVNLTILLSLSVWFKYMYPYCELDGIRRSKYCLTRALPLKTCTAGHRK